VSEPHVNSRDAMPTGGKLPSETTTSSIAATMRRSNLGARPGATHAAPRTRARADRGRSRDLRAFLQTSIRPRDRSDSPRLARAAGRRHIWVYSDLASERPSRSICPYRSQHRGFAAAGPPDHLRGRDDPARLDEEQVRTVARWIPFSALLHRDRGEHAGRRSRPARNMRSFIPSSSATS